MASTTTVPEHTFTITRDRLLTAYLRGCSSGKVATGRSPTYRVRYCLGVQHHTSGHGLDLYVPGSLSRGLRGDHGHSPFRFQSPSHGWPMPGPPDGRLILGGMAPSTPAAKIPRWCSRLKGAWLVKISDHTVSTIAQAQQVFAQLNADGASSVTLLFSHPEIRQDISHDGLPIVSSAPFSQHVHDQMNHRWDFSTVADYLRKAPPYKTVDLGDVLNYVIRVMRLTRGKLLQQDD